MAGRPSKLTPEITDELAQILEQGNWVDTACDQVGISRDTFYKWVARGKRGRAYDIEPVNYVEFALRIGQAVAQVEIDSVKELRKAPNNWQATAWWLERRHPDKWGNRGKLDVNLGGNVTITSDDLAAAREKARQTERKLLGNEPDAKD